MDMDELNHKSRPEDRIQPHGLPKVEPLYMEETAAEFYANPYSKADRPEHVGGRSMAYFGLVLSILSLFVFGLVLGAAGIILGFFARSRGATAIGTWAIVLGGISVAWKLIFGVLLF